MQALQCTALHQRVLPYCFLVCGGKAYLRTLIVSSAEYLISASTTGLSAWASPCGQVQQVGPMRLLVRIIPTLKALQTTELLHNLLALCRGICTRRGAYSHCR